VRATIVAQFPNLIIGITGGSDNSEVRNLGPQISLELPLFDRNQGNIAIERATRQKLHDEYAARLAATDAQVRAMVSEITLLTTQLNIAERDAVAIRRAGAAATTEFDDGNLDERSYIDPDYRARREGSGNFDLAAISARSAGRDCDASWRRHETSAYVSVR